MLHQLRSWWRAVRRRSTFERDMSDELRFHVESRAEDLIRSGISRDDATRRARLEFGNPEAYQERCRDARHLHLLDDLQRDLRFAFRSIRRDPILSSTIIVTLALGIGATSAIYGVVDGVLFRPLPFPASNRLMLVSGVKSATQGMPTLFGPDFLEARDSCDLCDDMAAYTGVWPSNVAGGSEPERVQTAQVTPSFFATLGVQPLLGRAFAPEDTGRPLFGSGPSIAPVTAVILGYDLWQRRFGGDPNIVGRAVHVEGDVSTVVGVMPRGFDFPSKSAAWVPATVNARRDNAYLRVIARLRPGVTPAAAEARLSEAASARNAAAKEERRLATFTVMPLQDYVVGDVRPALLTFLGAVAAVLLIACANVANLLLAQAAVRPRELAIRTSLGASRSRIVRQLLTESVLLAVVGGGLGLLLAAWLLWMFVAFGPADIPRLDGVSVDARVLGFTAALSILTGLLFGLAPVARTARNDPQIALQDGSGRASAGAGRQRVRKVLVVLQVSLALILLIGAGLLFKSFVQLRATPVGLDSTGILTATVTLPESTYPTVARAGTYLQESLDCLGALPDVNGVGLVNALPLGRFGARVTGTLSLDGDPADRRGTWTRKQVVGGRYFETAGIPVRRGRTFDDRDRENAPPVVIVSESLGRKLWPGQDPIGHRINIGFTGETWREVVGVVADVKHEELGDEQAWVLYAPFRQVAERTRWLLGEVTFVVRTRGTADGTAAALRSVFASLDKDIPPYDVTLMADVVARSTAGPRFYTMLLGSFSCLALLLAAAGTYGVMAYSVAQRTHELGIRIALGAGARSVLLLVVGEGLTLVLAGCAIGIAGAFAATRVLARFLHNVSPTDGATFAVISALLGVVALTACYLPARRAARIDPIQALRAD